MIPPTLTYRSCCRRVPAWPTCLRFGGRAKAKATRICLIKERQFFLLMTIPPFHRVRQTEQLGSDLRFDRAENHTPRLHELIYDGISNHYSSPLGSIGQTPSCCRQQRHDNDTRTDCKSNPCSANSYITNSILMQLSVSFIFGKQRRRRWRWWQCYVASRKSIRPPAIPDCFGASASLSIGRGIRHEIWSRPIPQHSQGRQLHVGISQ